MWSADTERLRTTALDHFLTFYLLHFVALSFQYSHISLTWQFIRHDIILDHVSEVLISSAMWVNGFNFVYAACMLFGFGGLAWPGLVWSCLPIGYQVFTTWHVHTRHRKCDFPPKRHRKVWLWLYRVFWWRRVNICNCSRATRFKRSILELAKGSYSFVFLYSIFQVDMVLSIVESLSQQPHIIIQHEKATMQSLVPQLVVLLGIYNGKFQNLELHSGLVSYYLPKASR